MPEVLTIKIDKKMNDKLYCQRCKTEREFVIRKVRLRVEEFSKDDTEEVPIICCSDCGTPIGTCNISNDEETKVNFYICHTC